MDVVVRVRLLVVERIVHQEGFWGDESREQNEVVRMDKWDVREN